MSIIHLTYQILHMVGSNRKETHLTLDEKNNRFLLKNNHSHKIKLNPTF